MDTLYQQHLAEINRYATFNDGWAEEDSLAPKKEDITNAFAVLSLWPQHLPLITPMISYDGTIGFYVDTDHYYIDIEIEKENTVSIYMRNRINNKEDFYEHIHIHEQLTNFLKEKIHFLVQK